MSYPIEKKFIPGLPHNAYRTGKPEGQLAHSTADPEADALREYAYFCDNWKTREAFVHFFVDWERIINTADVQFKCWGAGWTANQRFVQTELCETRDPVKFKQSYKRFVWLLARNAVLFGWDVDRKSDLWTHYDATYTFKDTNHVDPFGYLESHGVSKEQFFADVKKEYKAQKGNTISKPNYGSAAPAPSSTSSSTLKKGSKGAAVKELQFKLDVLGFDPKGVDGVFGANTEKAVRAFQKSKGLSVDGLAGKKTLSALEHAVAYPGKLIKEGSKGDAVKIVQRIVGVKVDGDFGPKTKSAVRKHQSDHHLKVDGLVGINTWNAFFK